MTAADVTNATVTGSKPKSWEGTELFTEGDNSSQTTLIMYLNKLAENAQKKLFFTIEITIDGTSNSSLAKAYPSPITYTVLIDPNSLVKDGAEGGQGPEAAVTVTTGAGAGGKTLFSTEKGAETDELTVAYGDAAPTTVTLKIEVPDPDAAGGTTKDIAGDTDQVTVTWKEFSDPEG